MTDPPRDADQSAPKPKRRYGWWMVFALAVLLVSLALTFLVPAYRQLALIERIEAAGGTIGRERFRSEWFRNLLGEERVRGFDNVVQIMFLGDSKIDNKLMEDIGTLTTLTHLKLNETTVSDTGLIHLKSLVNLRWLGLTETKISDAGLSHLKGLPKLQFLELKHTLVTEAGVKELQAALPDCEILWNEE